MTRFAAALLLLLSLPPLQARESITFSADSTVARFAAGSERTELIGDARVETEDLLITADRIELFGEDFRYLRCSGGVRLEQTAQGFLLRSEELFVDRERDLSRIESYAEMEDGENGLLIRGGFFEDRGGEDPVTVIQMGVRIMKISDGEVMICRSEFARYFRERQLLELSGLPRVDWKGDVYRASRILVDLETDEIRLEGRVSGTVETGGDGGGGAQQPPAEEAP